MPEPEAVISITGIEHQFNIKDNSKLKRDLIEAVISTESWIVTCGTESGTVQFIEEAVNAHIAIKNCHIPIVGILPQQFYDENRKENKHHEVISIKRLKKDNWVKIPCISMPEELDPIHTQFIFTNNGKRSKNGRETTCREAFEHFLLNINIKERDLETQEILPVILVLIEGGINALKTAKRILSQDNHVVVIGGSGGAADFLVTYYCRKSSMCREGNGLDGEMTKKDITDKIKDYFEEVSEMLLKDIEELSEWFLKKDKQEKIHIYSLNKDTNGVDEIIQDVMFEINKEYHENKIKKKTGIENENALKTSAVKEQLKLVEKWKRCDIAKNEIFLAKNRKHLIWLQRLDKRRMIELQSEVRKEIDIVKKRLNDLNYPKYYKTFQEKTKPFKGNRKPHEESNNEIKIQYLSLLSTSFNELFDHLPIGYLRDNNNEVKDIRYKLDVYSTRKKKTMTELYELEMQIGIVMVDVRNKYKSIGTDLPDLHRQFNNYVSEFGEVNNNKAKYFSNLSQSFEKMINHITVQDLQRHTHKLKKIVKDIVDEYKKDTVSQLFLTSITSNRKDLVELTMDRLENIEAFVFDKIANIYWRCIKESPEDLPIKLIEQVHL
ncbi:transient receptor potential cation channel trpm-like [Mytilus edulis]|uniref:transient receptor potential cation channel trpm-like n=1 Tax=Mytilus edulis TaxID=6550 RepID=UPI0039F0CB78